MFSSVGVGTRKAFLNSLLRDTVRHSERMLSDCELEISTLFLHEEEKTVHKNGHCATSAHVAAQA